jgi:hypothetical protein
MLSSRRFRYIAIHEAGHVVAHCRLGNGVIGAWLDYAHDGGRTTGKKKADPRTEMLCCYAGCFAEARYRRTSVVKCAVRGGQVDFYMAKDFADELEGDATQRRGLILGVEREVRRFIRQPDVWQQIEAVADVLVREGYIDGEHPLLVSE